MTRMSEELKIRKQEVRKEINRRLRDQDPSLRDERSLKIQKKLLSSEEFRLAGTVMTYVAMPTEVDTMYLIEEALRQGKKVIVPYIKQDQEKTMVLAELRTIEELEEGPYGILQPKNEPESEIDLKEIDLIVTPAIAYDANNMRLGRGKGYYDRFLSGTGLSASSIGVAFSFQVVDSLPHGPHDRPVFKVITD